MKKLIPIGLLLISLSSKAQTITFANFSLSLNDTVPAKLANNSSFNGSITGISGSNVTWDASALTMQSGTPIINLSYHAPSGTPNGNLYTSSNYCEFDPALTSVLEYNYYGISADSATHYGSYAPDGSHEIFQNPDKRLIFPFSTGQSFTDTYAKTNYSDATTISSYQTGTRTVTYAGYGDLILPQGTVHDIAFISEVRTNNIGPDSYYYTWIQVSTGVKWLLRTENNGSITTAWNSDVVPLTGIKESSAPKNGTLYPNPATKGSSLKFTQQVPSDNAELILYNTLGQQAIKIAMTNKEFLLESALLNEGLYFYELVSENKLVEKGKLIVR